MSNREINDAILFNGHINTLPIWLRVIFAWFWPKHFCDHMIKHLFSLRSRVIHNNVVIVNILFAWGQQEKSFIEKNTVNQVLWISDAISYDNYSKTFQVVYKKQLLLRASICGYVSKSNEVQSLNDSYTRYGTRFYWFI